MPRFGKTIRSLSRARSSVSKIFQISTFFFTVGSIFVALAFASESCRYAARLDSSYPDIGAGLICERTERQIARLLKDYESVQKFGDKIVESSGASRSPAAVRKLRTIERRRVQLQAKSLKANLAKLRRLIEQAKVAAARLEARKQSSASARFMGSLSQNRAAQNIDSGSRDLENTLLKASDTYIEYARLLRQLENSQ